MIHRENIMKNKLSIIILTAILGLSPMTGYSQQGSAGAAGGMSVGTAVAIGVVGAALLVALGDSSSSAPAAVPAATSSAATSASSTTAVSQTTTTTTTAATTTTTN